VILAWLGWTLIVIISPAVSDSYMLGMIQILGIPVAIIWAVFCLVDDIVSWKKPPTKIWKRFYSLGLISAILNAIIYSLWSVNIIAPYSVVRGLVIGLTLIIAIIGTIWSGALRHQEENHG
jgi:ABC-type multidrug transport system fused ATPase/permease subunit